MSATRCITFNSVSIMLAMMLTACGGGDNADNNTLYHSITANASTGGTITPTQSRVESGKTALFTLQANNGYELDNVTGCNGILNGNSYKTAVITEDCAVSAAFKRKSYTIKAVISEGAGSISPAEQTALHGDTVSITATPAIGYQLKTMEGCDGSLTASNQYTTAAVVADCQIQARFEAQSFTVGTQVTDGGRLSPENATVLYGGQTQFNVQPDNEFVLAGITGCNGTLVGNLFTTGNVTENCIVSARFLNIAEGNADFCLSGYCDGTQPKPLNTLNNGVAHVHYNSYYPNVEEFEYQLTASFGEITSSSLQSFTESTYRGVVDLEPVSGIDVTFVPHENRFIINNAQANANLTQRVVRYVLSITNAQHQTLALSFKVYYSFIPYIHTVLKPFTQTNYLPLDQEITYLIEPFDTGFRGELVNFSQFNIVNVVLPTYSTFTQRYDLTSSYSNGEQKSITLKVSMKEGIDLDYLQQHGANSEFNLMLFMEDPVSGNSHSSSGQFRIMVNSGYEQLVADWDSSMKIAAAEYEFDALIYFLNELLLLNGEKSAAQLAMLPQELLMLNRANNNWQFYYKGQVSNGNWLAGNYQSQPVNDSLAYLLDILNGVYGINGNQSQRYSNDFADVTLSRAKKTALINDYINQLNSIRGLNLALLPDADTLTRTTLNSGYGSYFSGNTFFGRYDENNVWIFKPEYQYLNTVHQQMLELLTFL